MFDSSDFSQARLKVVGVGGGGGNTVAHILDRMGPGDAGIEIISANTDQQALQRTPDHALSIGLQTTRGLGAGANPSVGFEAANESRAEIKARLAGADMVFITAGMGGGTGTGASSVVAEIAREMGALTVGIVTRPFGFEGGRRTKAAEEGIKALQQHVDSLITIPNDNLLPVLGKQMSLVTAFAAVNDVLRDAVHGIADLITTPGLINVDFADVRTVMSHPGYAKIGTGEASGEMRAREATLAAINSPLLDDFDIHGAQGILVSIKAGPNLSIGEFNEVGSTINEFASDSATVVVGTTVDMDASESLVVTVVATGLEGEAPPARS